MYAEGNPKTKKALVEMVQDGKCVKAFQPGPFPAQTEGNAVIEGPQYPEAHKWYASVVLKDGRIVAIQHRNGR